MNNAEPSLVQIRDSAIGFAHTAGSILQSHFGNVGTVRAKSDNKSDIVSQVDTESEEYLRTAIKKQYPGHGILGEEGTEEQPDGSGFLWVLDPLDGTLNYVNGLPIYSVSIGVLHHGVPEVGCIWVPWPGVADGVIFSACKGQGAFKDDEPISVQSDPVPQPAHLNIFHRDFRLHYLRNAGSKAPIGEGRGPGSLAYEMALTSNGVFQYAVFTSPRIWDVAAGIVLIKEAGGLVLTYENGPRGWHEFSSFSSAAENKEVGVDRIRDWHSPIMAGCGELVWHLAKFAKPSTFWSSLAKSLGINR